MPATRANSTQPVAPRRPRRATALGANLANVAALAALIAVVAGCNVYASLHNPLPPAAYRIDTPAHHDADATTRFQPDRHQALVPQHPAVLDRRRVAIPTPPDPQPADDYVLGPGDRLHVNVNGDPRLSSVALPLGGGVIGARLDGQGRIQLPELGAVDAAGLTVDKLRRQLEDALVKQNLIRDPWVTVEVVAHRSQPLYLIGQFNEPGVVYMDRPTRLVHAIAMGKGLNELANLRDARLLRDRRIVPVDIYYLLKHGDFEQNVWLLPGDTVYVPDLTDQRVFVLGKVLKPGWVEMVHGEMTLSQAVTAAGGFDNVGSRPERVRIIRSLSQTRGELLVVDLKRILRGEALPFPLTPGDIVFIPNSPMGDWNDALKEITPTLQAIGATVSPFAQIAVASND